MAKQEASVIITNSIFIPRYELLYRSATTFHPDACAAVTEVLTQLEEWKRNGSIDASSLRSSSFNEGGAVVAVDIIQQEIKSRLKTILRTRTLRGFPLNISFTDIDDVIVQVKALAIHENNHPEVQFVMAVRAFPLVNNMVSLWIFLGTLETSSN